MFCMDDMVSQNHMLRLIDRAVDWTFIYDLVGEKYCPDNRIPGMDPDMLIKILFISEPLQNEKHEADHQAVINMAGFSDTAFIQGMNMTAVHSKQSMIR